MSYPHNRQLPDHVTRCNHKYESRWMAPAREPSRITMAGIGNAILFALSGAGIILSAVMMRGMGV